MSTRIVVKEDSDPLLTIRLKKKIPGGGTNPYLLDGNPEVEFYVKAKLSDPDGSALFTYTKAAGTIVIIDDGTGVGTSTRRSLSNVPPLTSPPQQSTTST